MTSGARSSSSNYVSGPLDHNATYNHDIGASEHKATNVWTGALAFTNIGLAGSAFSGSQWLSKHQHVLLGLFTELLNADERPQGLLLCEVGNLSDLITAEGKTRLEQVLTTAFGQAGDGQHEKPQFFWSNGETMAAFTAELKVEMLQPLRKMARVEKWRTADRFKITGATEHGECKLLIYNNHQPISKERPFKPTQKINFCKGILKDAMKDHAADDLNIGFGFGGDANCSMSQWTTAVDESRPFALHYQIPYYMFGRGRKGGDLMIGCSGVGKNQLIFFENRCEVEGREKMHDPMIMAWRYQSSKSEPLSPLPQRVNLVQRRWKTHEQSQPLPPNTGQSLDENASGEHADEPEQAAKQTNSGAQEHAEEEADCIDMEEVEEDADESADESADAIRSIGFALVNTASLLPEFALPRGSKNCIDSAAIDTMRNACSAEDI